MAAPKYQEQRLVRQPVDITFTVRSSRGYLMGSEVSNALMKLTMVEFSYYMGFPVLQIAERKYQKVLCYISKYSYVTTGSWCVFSFLWEHLLNELKLTPPKHHFVLFPTAFHYPELNTSHVLRSSWVRTGTAVSILDLAKSCYSYLKPRDPLCWYSICFVCCLYT